uniref:hypothetical protein n=1 Tax=Oscillospiraceae TaxID=216572 RepID=UPI001A9BC411
LNQSSKNIDKYDVFGRFTFYKVAKSGGVDNLAKKESAQYIVEREFLGKFSVEELLVRIVKSHVKKGLSRG